MDRKTFARIALVGVLLLVVVAGSAPSVAAVDNSRTVSDDCDDEVSVGAPACARDDRGTTSKEVLDRVGSKVAETPNGDEVVRILQKRLP